MFNMVLSTCMLVAACSRPSSPEGTISGYLLMAGGPTSVRLPVAGVVIVEGTDVSVDVGLDGSYSIRVPPGRYVLSGHSLEYNDDVGRCEATTPAIVIDGGETSVDVLCQMR